MSEHPTEDCPACEQPLSDDGNCWSCDWGPSDETTMTIGAPNESGAFPVYELRRSGVWRFGIYRRTSRS